MAGGGPQCTAVVTGLTPQLAIAVAADASTSTPGSTISYTMTIENIGETDYLAATVTDDLSGILDRADYSHNESTTTGVLLLNVDSLSWTGDLPVGGSAVVTFGVRVHDPFIGDLTLVNRIESEELGSNCQADSADPGCSSTVSVLIPELTMSITAETGVVTPGDIVGYTVVISNTGQTSFDHAEVWIELVGALDNAELNPDRYTDVGEILVAGPELLWVGDLPVGTTATVSFSMTVHSPGDGSMTASVLTSLAGSTCANANSCVSTVTVNPPGAELTVSAASDTATAVPGDEVRFTISVVNSSQTPYQETTVTMPLDDIIDDATLTGYLVASSGRVGYTAPTLTWTGDVPAGGTVTITYAATVNETTIREHSLTGTVRADGSNCALGTTDPACTVDVPVLIPRLTISTFADVATTTPGSVVHYFISIANSGETAYTGRSCHPVPAGRADQRQYNGDAYPGAGNRSTTPNPTSPGPVTSDSVTPSRSASR